MLVRYKKKPSWQGVIRASISLFAPRIQRRSSEVREVQNHPETALNPYVRASFDALVTAILGRIRPDAVQSLVTEPRQNSTATADTLAASAAAHDGNSEVAGT